MSCSSSPLSHNKNSFRSFRASPVFARSFTELGLAIEATGDTTGQNQGKFHPRTRTADSDNDPTILDRISEYAEEEDATLNEVLEPRSHTVYYADGSTYDMTGRSQNIGMFERMRKNQLDIDVTSMIAHLFERPSGNRDASPIVIDDDSVIVYGSATTGTIPELETPPSSSVTPPDFASGLNLPPFTTTRPFLAPHIPMFVDPPAATKPRRRHRPRKGKATRHRDQRASPPRFAPNTSYSIPNREPSPRRRNESPSRPT